LNRTRILILAILLTLSAASISWGLDYVIDAEHSSVLLNIKHLGISTVTGRFEKFTGSFGFDPDDVRAAIASTTIDAASINTNVPFRDKHLRSSDFLDVEKYPEITFIGRKVTDVDQKNHRFKLFGDLTIHGVTKPVTLDVQLGGSTRDPDGKQRIGFTATTQINRRDYGLVWNRIIEGGGLLVGKEVPVVGEQVWITLDVEGVAPTPTGN